MRNETFFSIALFVKWEISYNKSLNKYIFSKAVLSNFKLIFLFAISDSNDV